MPAELLQSGSGDHLRHTDGGCLRPGDRAQLPAPASRRIRGVVRDAGTGAGLASVQIDLFGAFQGQLTGYGRAMTDAAGAYTIGNLPPGNYYAMSSQSQGYVDQFFGDVWCPGQCSFSNADSGAPIGVMAGADVGGRDFALRPGGSISGRITGVLSPGSATPVANATVFAYALLGDQLANGRGTSTDATGHYTLAGLASGLYYVQIYPPTTDGLLGQFYGGSPCGQGCSFRLPMNGVPVAVATGTPTTGQDRPAGAGRVDRGGRDQRRHPAPAARSVCHRVRHGRWLAALIRVRFDGCIRLLFDSCLAARHLQFVNV